MKREIYAKLLEWQSRRDHKPLVLDGARQVGKTYILKEFKGAFTECYVNEQLARIQIPTFYYSTNESEVEIDFTVQTEKRVIPIEAKAEENVRAKSLKTYIDVHPNLKGLRLSMLNYIDQGWMENLPLYAIEGYLRAEGIPVPDPS